MVEIPDSARPYVNGFVKYHFWILAAVVPFVLVPSVFSANAGMRQQITAQKSSIDGHVSALQAIQSEADHPNPAWVEAVDGRTAAVRRDILEQWKAFWASQQPLRVWPQELGQDFLATIQSVEDQQLDRLPSNLLQRYQNEVPDIVRQLPARMGCKELMVDSAATGVATTAGVADEGESPEASLTHDPLVWRSEDQRRLLASFVWTREPSTAQVRLSQEEIWVYSLFCDTIRSLNREAKGAFDATITSVEDLAVGFPAAEDIPGGRGGTRVMWKKSPTAAAAGAEEMVAASAVGGLDDLSRPSHPRFNASESLPAPDAAPVAGGVSEEGVPVVTKSPDDMFREWIYVDFEGRPLSAAALKTIPDATMVHLMPFTLRVVIDQRKLDRLLQSLAANAIPIDVRQVRINPGAQASDGSGPLSSGAPAGFSEAMGKDSSGRPQRSFDVLVELRGTVGLATPPDEAPLGGQPLGEDGGGAL